jgi:hypothetical protein
MSRSKEDRVGITEHALWLGPSAPPLRECDLLHMISLHCYDHPMALPLRVRLRCVLACLFPLLRILPSTPKSAKSVYSSVPF